MDTEKTLQKLLDVYEVQQCASTYSNLISYGGGARIPDLFTKHTPGLKIQITNWGVWEGADALRRLFDKMKDMVAPDGYTWYSRHELTSPHIEIAEDRETAIGSWFSPGWETWPSGCAKIASFWNWGAYRMVFRREDGVWKIWRLKYLIGLDCDTTIGWVEGSVSPHSQIKWDKWPADVQPDHPGTDFVYSPNGPKLTHLMPLPEPYKTWSEDMCIIDK